MNQLRQYPQAKKVIGRRLKVSTSKSKQPTFNTQCQQLLPSGKKTNCHVFLSVASNEIELPVLAHQALKQKQPIRFNALRHERRMPHDMVMH